MRILLKGEGDPIPEFALPDIYIDPDFPIQTFVMSDGENFPAGDFVLLGYTNFEVWCVGAAGGRGGGGWGVSGGFDWHQYGVPNPPNPTVVHWHDPFMTPEIGWGGGGGGGGLHHVSGLLVDLDTLVPVVIGQVGVDGPHYAYLQSPTPVTPDPPWPPDPHPNHVYDPPIYTFYPPVDGGNGGASTFGGTICCASGGKGGKKTAPGAVIPPSNQAAHAWDAAGGEGGAGNRVIAGGGGAGSTTASNASDGSWDGVIGQGGGGGRGGVYFDLLVVEGHDPPPVNRISSSGGQGSFSFGDTSVYGPRESKGSAALPSWYPSTGGTPTVTKTVVPGSGGGAKPVQGIKAGSHAPGFDPNGAVIVRISKVTA